MQIVSVYVEFAYNPKKNEELHLNALIPPKLNMTLIQF